jgi:hypothetical protein
MSENQSTRWGTLIQVQDPRAAALWLTENLFFSPASSSGIDVDPASVQLVLTNDNCLLVIEPGDSAAVASPAAGYYHTGLAHIALRTDRIADAIAWCQSRQLTLQLDGTGSFFNPKVFGGGERFFNIISPFGVTFEVSQRVDYPSPFQGSLICGLDHLGIPSPDIEGELTFFKNCGFVPEFSTVTNWNADEGTIYCCMLSQKDPEGHEMTLEIYQFADMKPLPLPDQYGIKGLVFDGSGRRSSAGVHLA